MLVYSNGQKKTDTSEQTEKGRSADTPECTEKDRQVDISEWTKKTNRQIHPKG